MIFFIIITFIYFIYKNDLHINILWPDYNGMGDIIDDL